MVTVEPAMLEWFIREPRSRPAEFSERLLRRARMLGPRERLLIELTLANRLTRRQIGLLLGLSPGSVCRRIRSLTRLLHDPLVIALLDERCTLPPEHRQVGIEHFVRRRPIIAVARARGVRFAEVSGMLDYIRGWFNASRARR